MEVSATVQLIFDQGPLIRWQVDLDSRGTDFRVDLVFETSCAGQVLAGMPFDVVERPTVDTDLLPAQLEDRVGSNSVRAAGIGERSQTFPFQNFVAASNGETTAMQCWLKGCMPIRPMTPGQSL